MARKALLATLAVAPAAVAAATLLVPHGEATTRSGLIRRIDVTLTDSRVTIERDRWERGTVGHFQVRNAGRKPNNFIVGFVRTRVLMPGERQTIELTLERRGPVPYRSSLACGPRSHGVIHVV